MSTLREEALKMHRDHHGKVGIYSKVQVHDGKDLSLAYSPGVAEPCLDIHADERKVYDYTSKGNLVAVVSNGTAVLGLGNIGPKAAMPVMEGKSVLFKAFADVDAFPICLDTKDIDKIVETVKLLEPTFGGVNLEDIAAPQCFEIEERLRKICDIPVFHDDQHGTAIVTAAGLINALK
jgi:malate dehydrogenase (oxaloacetate-decarboxylating)